jgi:hypothetical protein
MQKYTIIFTLHVTWWICSNPSSGGHDLCACGSCVCRINIIVAACLLMFAPSCKIVLRSKEQISSLLFLMLSRTSRTAHDLGFVSQIIIWHEFILQRDSVLFLSVQRTDSLRDNQWIHQYHSGEALSLLVRATKHMIVAFTGRAAAETHFLCCYSGGSQGRGETCHLIPPDHGRK